MSDETARLSLPLIVPGQAQKEMFHNEALAMLDAAVQASVLAIGIDTPPAEPAPGQCWVIGETPTGDWAAHAGDLAIWTQGGWRFVRPTSGFRVWSIESEVDAQFLDGAWAVGTLAGDRLVIGGNAMLSTPAAPIVDPAGGTAADAEARIAIAAILAALRHHNLVEGA